jgi:cysteine-rich repeat protein
MPEECDDANVDPGDGCSPDCTKEHPEVCPGTKITLALGESRFITGTTDGASDKFTSSKTGIPNSNCMNGTYSGPDVVYQVIPDANGTLNVEVTAQFASSWLHVRSQCPGSTNDELACRYTGNAGNTLTSTTQVVKDTPYYVIVDSWNGTSGPFKLMLSLQ